MRDAAGSEAGWPGSGPEVHGQPVEALLSKVAMARAYYSTAI
jgi:hypothetical protein